MIIGILSDTHGRLDPVRQAVEVFRRTGAQAVFHCGDIGGIDVLTELAAFTRRLWFVWGNVDLPDHSWADAIARLGLHWPEGPLVVELGAKRIALAHGHEVQYRLLEHDATLDYILSGHTHECGDWRNGRARHINPGALHRAATRTVATLDLQTDALSFHQLRR